MFNNYYTKYFFNVLSNRFLFLVLFQFIEDGVPLHCECGLEFLSLQQLAKHRRSYCCFNLTFRCSECDFKTRYKGNLKQHYNTKHNPNAMTYSCGLCEYKSFIRSKVRRHVVTMHTKAFETGQTDLLIV